ncbi:MAG: hypothetical protein ABH952_08775 [Candidatus Omnitrophota bacterium]
MQNVKDKKTERNLQVAINEVLFRNALLLFNNKNKSELLYGDVHVCNKLSELPGRTKTERIVNSIIIAMHLWNSWEIHIRNSTYSFQWYGCVQVENEWLEKGKGVPPYVTFDSKEPLKIKDFKKFKSVKKSEFPFDIDFDKLFYHGKVIIKKAYFEEDEVTVWRICHE